MDGVSMAATSVSAPQKSYADPATRTLSPGLLRVISGILVMGNVLFILAAGYGCALAYAHWAEPSNKDLAKTALRLSLLAALLSVGFWQGRPSATHGGHAMRGRELARACRDLAVLTVLVLSIAWLTLDTRVVPMDLVLVWVACLSVAVIGGRVVLSLVRERLVAYGFVKERVAVIACDPASDRLTRHIAQLRRSGVRVVALYDRILDDRTADLGAVLSQVLHLGRHRQIDRIIVAGTATDERRVIEIVQGLKGLDIDVGYYPSPDLVDPATNYLAAAPFLMLARRPIGPWGRIAKGLKDRALAAVMIIILAPLLALIALAIKLDSPGPVIFRQPRHGRNGRAFDVLKFRTMTWQPNAGSGAVQTLRTDSRITRIGGFLRRSSLDELPQLFNLLNGSMSLVGPRPLPVAMLTQNMTCEEIVAEYTHRHRVKPGITGWAQVTGHRGATQTTEQVRLRVEQDIYYIDNWSLMFDLKIMLLTPYSVIFQRENAF